MSLVEYLHKVGMYLGGVAKFQIVIMRVDKESKNLLILIGVLVVLFLAFGSESPADINTRVLMQQKSKSLANRIFKEECVKENIGGNLREDGYGMWPVCTNAVKENPIVYSFGIGGDISFDLEMVKRFNASVYCYDPTVAVEKFKAMCGDREESKSLYFKPIGLALESGTISFYELQNHKDSPVLSGEDSTFNEKKLKFVKAAFSLDVFMKMNDHDWIDILKIDIESNEFNLLEKIEESSLKTTQLLLEFHARFVVDGYERQNEIYRRLESFGFEKVYEHQNKQEVIFLRRSISM